jgi:predicted O-linked N-acetylglucosamine transferase (SPINDLY family)
MEQGYCCLCNVNDPDTGLVQQKSQILEWIHQGQLEAALSACQQLCVTEPADAGNWCMLASLQGQLGRLAEAIAQYRKALELQPELVPAWFSLGNLLYRCGDMDGAEHALRRALQYRPDFFEARANLGKLLRTRLQFSAAGEQFSAALALQPGSADTCNELGLSLNAQGHTDAAEQAFRRALELDPGFHAAGSNLLLALNYTTHHTPVQVFDEHLRQGRMLGLGVASNPEFSNRPDPARRLRIGYLSADFRDHSVASFFTALPQHHDRTVCEVFCYADVGSPDHVTRQLQALADNWRNIHGRTDADVIVTIRNDNIDILVDLGGHTAANRLPVFAARAAPLQVTWLGYPNTTGVPGMDYRLVDAYTDPPGSTDVCHSESLVRLPGCFLCYTPPMDVALPALPDAGERRAVTFGSFNSYIKMTSEVFGLWATILQAVPEARMLIKNFSLNDPGVRTECLRRFATLGIAPERLDLHGVFATKVAHLSLYGKIDIGLDTFPYNGTTTTCEALWMGIPVITLAGDRHAGRVGVSLLSAAGLPQLIAQDAAEYRELAIALAANNAQRRRWRTELRDLLRHSPLCDDVIFCRKVEVVWRELWSGWCQGR